MTVPTTFRHRTSLAIFAGTLLGAGATQAANVASDNASNNPPYPTTRQGGGLATGQNGGSGFGPWTINQFANGGYTGTFIDDSSRNGGNTSNINTGDRLAWAFYAGGNGFIEGIRPLTGGALSIGQSISLSLDNGDIQNNKSVGFGFRDASGANRLEVNFVGGTNSYAVSNGSMIMNSAHGFTRDGLSANFTLTGIDTYSLALNFNATATQLASIEIFTGTLGGASGGGIADIRVYDNSAGSDVYFNSFDVTAVPEPSTVFAGAIMAFALGVRVVKPRRRRLA